MTEIGEVRPARLGDAADIYRLLTQFVVSYEPQRGKFDLTLPELIASATAHLLVAERQGTILGYALALRVPTLYANGPLWELQELMVDPDNRSQGVGRRLLEAVIAHARADRAAEVVVPSRRAGAYYEKFGFAEVASYYKFKLTDQPPPVLAAGKEKGL